MWLDAILAYLHFASIFLLFSFLVVETMMLRGRLEEREVRLLGRVDIWYFGAAIAVLVTGFTRLVWGAKGPDFYLASWPIYVKLALFLLVGILSVGPTLRFIEWRRRFERDASWGVPEAQRKRARRSVMIELHLAALIPFFAVIMARGLGR